MDLYEKYKDDPKMLVAFADDDGKIDLLKDIF